MVKAFISFTAALILVLSSLPALAIDAVYTGWFNNRAISGYDAVSYFTEGKPVKGKSKFATDYLGATWRFSSQENLDLFVADPEAYAPQYGGYCAYAMSEGKVVSAQPDEWTIYEGKLYLNFNGKTNKLWSEDKAGFVEKANAEWPKLELESE